MSMTDDFIDELRGRIKKLEKENERLKSPLPVESGWSDDDLKKAFNAASEGGYEYVSYDTEGRYEYVKKYDNADEYLKAIKNQGTT